MTAAAVCSDKTVALVVNQQAEHSIQILLSQMFADGGLLEFSLLPISKPFNLWPRLLPVKLTKHLIGSSTY